MQPNVTINVEGGTVQAAETNVPGLSVVIYDHDLKESGEAFEIDLEPTYTGTWKATPITPEERARFDREMEGNQDGANTTVDVLLHIIGTVPTAAAAFRGWLAEAEAHTRLSESEEGPDGNALANHEARSSWGDTEEDRAKYREAENLPPIGAYADNEIPPVRGRDDPETHRNFAGDEALAQHPEDQLEFEDPDERGWGRGEVAEASVDTRNAQEVEPA